MAEANGTAPAPLTAAQVLAACTRMVETSIGPVKVRRVGSGELAASSVLGPVLEAGGSEDEMAERIKARMPQGAVGVIKLMDDTMDAVCAIGLVSPRAHVGDDERPDSIPVRVLGNDRKTIYDAIMELSGLSAGAAAAAAFRDPQGAREPAPGTVVEAAGAPA